MLSKYLKKLKVYKFKDFDKKSRAIFLENDIRVKFTIPFNFTLN